MNRDDPLEPEPFERIVADCRSRFRPVPLTPRSRREHPADLDLVRRDLFTALAEMLRVRETQSGAIVLRDDPAPPEIVLPETGERRFEVPLRRVTVERPARAPVPH